MGGAGSMSAMNSSLANNRALLKKRRLKNNAYLNADIVSRTGTANYEELKAWRLHRAKVRSRARITVLLTCIVSMALVCYFVFTYLT